jgi:8-oxo-dGTP pyrophosphatase MutT (NUDIX family)
VGSCPQLSGTGSTRTAQPLVWDRRSHHHGPVQLCEDLRRVLAERRRLAMLDGEAVRCAVLVPLIPEADAFRVLYTRRTEHLPDHSGQVAFPGGKYHASDPSLLETALRETREEVGIETEAVQVLGRLDDVTTLAARYVVTPFVAVLPPDTSFRPNPAEVADIFTVGIDELRNPERHATQPRTWDGMVYHVDVITAGSHNIWGLTLHITRNLLACVEAACYPAR